MEKQSLSSAETKCHSQGNKKESMQASIKKSIESCRKKASFSRKEKGIPVSIQTFHEKKALTPAERQHRFLEKKKVSISESERKQHAKDRAKSESARWKRKVDSMSERR